MQQTRATLSKRRADVSAMFDGVAARYDLLNDILSLGQDRGWRRATLAAVAPQRGERILDLAAGTGTSSVPFAQAGAPVIVGGVLPLDLVGHRSGRADLLVRGDDTPDGRPGYWPVRIKTYSVVEKQLGATHLSASPLDDLATLSVLPDLRYRAYRETTLLELAHVWRLLEACGYASATPLAGVIGQDKRTSESVDQVVWVRLDHRFIRTFSRTAPEGHRLRSALERYDHEHGFRVHVAESAKQRTGVDDPPPVVRPIRVRECEWCAWWQVCRPRMDDDDLSLRISKTPLDVRELQTLMSLGIRTVAELATADIDALLPSYLPLTAHRDRSEQRLRQAARRARMLAEGVELERISVEPIGIPRAEVEVDLDIETAEGDLTYLWGALVTHRTTGRQEFHHISGFGELAEADEVELAARFSRWLVDLVARHPGLRVYHYSDYETVHLRRLADRSQHPDILAALDLVPEHFVDLFGYIRDNFVGVEGLGLKTVATKGPKFAWRDEEPGGLNSQSWFDTAVHGATPEEREAARTRVLEYNEDDVRATWAVREWLTEGDADPLSG